MFLKRLTLSNVRSIRELEMDFTADDGDGVRRWTLLLGENGSGKSTVLRAAALVMAGSDALLELLGSPDPWIRNRAKTARIGATLETAKGEQREISLELKAGQSLTSILRQNADSLSQLDDALGHAMRNYLTLGYGVSRRLSSGDGLKSRGSSRFHSSRARCLASLFDPDVSLVSIEDWAMDLHYRKQDAGLKIVKETFKGFLPNVTFKTINRERRELIFDTEDGPVPLRQLSDGYQNIIAWCGDLLFQITDIFDDYKSPLKSRGLLLLDELGLHLHPMWQRHLIEFLNKKLPNFQILATTHSPLTAHQAGDGELFFLKRAAKSKQVELHAFEGAPNLLMLHQLIMTPAFGIGTVNSTEAVKTQGQYEKLRAKKNKTNADKREMAQLKTQLDEFTSWDEMTTKDRKLDALLSKIEGRLSEKG